MHMQKQVFSWTQETDGDAQQRYRGLCDHNIRFIEEISLLDPVLWRRFVEQFRLYSDSEKATWKGEYWGKMMRGAAFTYSYTQNEALYAVLTATVEDMLASADDLGRISTYSTDKEFDGWDLWCRKYVLLGMQYYAEICKDAALIERLKASMCAQLDYIMSKIGTGQGKRAITSATRHWRGLNSVSILEPVVRLYKLTGEKRYLDFADYIVSTGGTSVVNIFDLAYEDQLHPYQYPVTKAYEMTSCFEGLLEYYTVTGEGKHRTAIINFANQILAHDFTVIGCSGCTHELFDHSTVRQANTTNYNTMQETCVTVTLMKFFYRLNMLTGDARYADAFETSLYNAYFGSINTEGVIEPTVRETLPGAVYEPLPFDSYSPLTANTRGKGIGGLQLMPDNHYYGCCACIGSMGNGLIPKMLLMKREGSTVINLYTEGVLSSTTASGRPLQLTVCTDYPVAGHIEIQVGTAAAEQFAILLRNPAWSKTTRVLVNGSDMPVCDGYITLERTWRDGDVITLELDMRTEAIRPIPYGHQVLMNKVIWGQNYMIPTYDEEDPRAKDHVALRRGPLVLAVDNRLGYDVDSPLDIAVDEQGYADVRLAVASRAPYSCIAEFDVKLTDGGFAAVTDYASAGKTWNEESKMAAWILVKA